jgi:hypothetical protein
VATIWPSISDAQTFVAPIEQFLATISLSISDAQIFIAPFEQFVASIWSSISERSDIRCSNRAVFGHDLSIDI